MVKVLNTNKKDASKDAKLATEERIAYMKKHKLKEDKDYSKDKVHGPILAQFDKRIQLGHIKATEGIKEDRESKKKNLKKPEVHKKKKDAPVPNTYEYPTLNGKPMGPDSKRKFRSKMRPLLKSGMATDKASKIVLEKYFNNTFPAKTGSKVEGKKKEEPKKEEPKAKKLVKKVVKKSTSKRSDD